MLKVSLCAVLSLSVVSDSLGPHGPQPVRHLYTWGFSRQEHRSGLPCPRPGFLPNPGIESRSPALHADSLAAEPQGKPFSVQSRYLIKALWNGALLLGSEVGEFCPWNEFKAQGTNSRACLCHPQVLQFGAQ